MTTTTDYADWADVMHEGTATVEDHVAAALDGYTGDYDVPAIVSDYREAINQALPQGVTLHERLITGPYPLDHELHAAIRPAVESVDFWAIVARHDRTIL